ncbi:DMT family transporter [Thalassococcus sp. S3]|uniref:DMT family transporter n=1 Tax=Thalassococcus sp. S3 TaxID=2017482 RepID=UPI00102432CE|nr:DMT family transporter [Thalassococcus sp. S3]QBF29826.1 hypothetical protein CFI11_01155 [Thalassococcus sp. S3]
MSVPTSSADPTAAWRAGVFYGVAASVMWASFMIATRTGTIAGLRPSDLLVLRFGTAALIVLPWVLARGIGDLGGVGWRRGIALSLFAGPPFFGLTVLGYTYAPLAHGAVIQPSVAALSSLIGAALVLGERAPLVRFAGAGLIVLGLLFIGFGQSGVPLDGAWRGDLLFIGAGLCWAVFTLLLKHWQIGGLQAAAAIAVLSGLTIAPLCLLLFGWAPIQALPTQVLLVQMIVHGLCASVLAILAFGRAVALLGAGTAALFPALVPVFTLTIGAPISGEIPSLTEIMGAIIATLGLLVALGWTSWRPR